MLLHIARLVLKGDNIDMSGNALGLTLESNGVRILEPFDTSIKFSRASGKTNMHIAVSDIFINFTFSILRLFLAVEEDIMAFLRRTSKKMTVECSQFDKVGKIESRLIFYLLMLMLELVFWAIKHMVLHLEIL